MRTRVSLSILAILASAVVVIVVMHSASSVRAAVNEPGRYQLVQGRYQINAESTSLDGTAVFKIDTQTGSAWIYREGSREDSKERRFWSEWRKINEQVK